MWVLFHPTKYKACLTWYNKKLQEISYSLFNSPKFNLKFYTLMKMRAKLNLNSWKIIFFFFFFAEIRMWMLWYWGEQGVTFWIKKQNVLWRGLFQSENCGHFFLKVRAFPSCLWRESMSNPGGEEKECHPVLTIVLLPPRIGKE
jgi:hypothetical protein